MNRRQLRRYALILVTCLLTLSSRAQLLFPWQFIDFDNDGTLEFGQKFNFNWLALSNMLATNGIGGGGGAFMEKFNGGATNPVFTNVVTLRRDDPYYRITTLTFTNLSEVTNAYGGYNWSTGTNYDALTNAQGIQIINLNPPFCTNWGGSFASNSTTGGTTINTNPCGWQTWTNYCTDPTGPYLLATNLAPNAYTNRCGFVVFGSFPCPNQNGPYLLATNISQTCFTNVCGYRIFLSDLCSNFVPTVSEFFITNAIEGNGRYLPSDTSQIVFTNTTILNFNLTHSYIVVSNAGTAAANGVYTNVPWFTLGYTNIGSGFFMSYSIAWTLYQPGAFAYYNTVDAPLRAVNGYMYTNNTKSTGGSFPVPNMWFFGMQQNNYYGYFVSNVWQTFSADTVTYGSSSITVVGSYYSRFFVTNAGYFPASNTIYDVTSSALHIPGSDPGLATNYGKCMFSLMINSNYFQICGSQNIYTNVPPSTITVTIISAPPSPPYPPSVTPTNAPPTNNPVPPSPPPPPGNTNPVCKTYISWRNAANTACRTFTPSPTYIAMIGTANAQWTQSGHTITFGAGWPRNPNYILVNSVGDFIVVMGGVTNIDVPQNNAAWQLNEPPDVCDQCKDRAFIQGTVNYWY